MQNYPLWHKTSKNAHVQTKKENFSTTFSYFAFFLKPGFGVLKTSFTPLISAIWSSIGLKIFLVGLQLIWVGSFSFQVDIFYQSNLPGFAKILGFGNQLGFGRFLVFWFSSPNHQEFFNKKKNCQPKSGKVFPIKFSVRSDFKWPR